jgi:integrase
MGRKNLKGTVGIIKDGNRIRLRFRYQSKRYSLNLFQYNKANLLEAKKVALAIEQDIVSNQFDITLSKYNGTILTNLSTGKTMVEYFEEWTATYKQMDCNVNSDYFNLRNTIKRWDKVNENNILPKLNGEAFNERTYNRRLTMLSDFADWLVKQHIWTTNPLEDVSRKKCKKVADATRKPFTEKEIKLILDAFRNDTYLPKSSRYKHSHYYPFVYFIFKTGVRNAEAIGLRVGSIGFEKHLIHITEVMARTVNGTHAAARVRKETKNGKERSLPLTPDLLDLLTTQTVGKGKDDLVFPSPNGLPIDDRMFQRRIFKKVLESLDIPPRILYACRHTFGSRCIDAGMTPVMTAFLMGNNPETALRNYTHQMNIPKNLPII